MALLLILFLRTASQSRALEIPAKGKGHAELKQSKLQSRQSPAREAKCCDWSRVGVY